MDTTPLDVELAPKQQSAPAFDGEGDWTGLNAAERRKRQNRLHQRAWRKRRSRNAIPKNNDGQPSILTSPVISQEVQLREAPHLEDAATDGWKLPTPLDGTKPTFSESILMQWSHTAQPSSILSLLNLEDLLPEQLSWHTSYDVVPSHERPLIPPILPYLNTCSRKRPIPPVHFPLTPDHRLITLIQYNVLRATLTNMALLNLLHTLPTYCSAAIVVPLTFPSPPPNSIPASLRPTVLQQTTPHEPWIDLIPCAPMRDNLMLFKGAFDQEDLCGDLVGGLYEGFNDVENRGMVVWGEPWLADGWEVSEGFVKKWGFLLKGCQDMLRSTNEWRRNRGEGELRVEEL
ncbi:hypothetical protein BJ875DRAFT_4107 [Amylocarpus encephaloides]|uniref:BZIP domain-containing protein n=1 Tax=Amylocarpus encephaloides TaxID=45428 RepID=A0A9P7YS70_9HELO|nr:hypothetical protein BJ875DRAFT_4107 [Amylocarpus encephaloides]